MKNYFILLKKSFFTLFIIVNLISIIFAAESAKQSVESKDEKPKTEINGLLFADYKIDFSEKKDSASNVFEVTRLYVTISQKISDKVFFKSILEGTQPANPSIFLKNAFVELFDLFPCDTKLRLGVIPTPWIGFEEQLWKHRFVQKTFTDNEGLLPAADLGIGLAGNFLKKVINYDFVFVNGEGYKSSEVSSDKAFGLRVSAELTKGLKLHLYEHLNRTGPTSNTVVEKNRTIIAGSYEEEKLTLMGNCIIANDSNVNKLGFSIHGSYFITPETDIFARFDMLDPNRDQDDDAYNRITLGVSKLIAKNVNLAFDIQQKNVQKEAGVNKNEFYFFTHIFVKY